MPLRTWLLLSLIFSGALAAEERSDPLIMQLAQRAASIQGMVSDFVQIREHRVLKRALESRGQFVFLRTIGIEWRTETPFRSAVAIGNDAVIESDGSGLLRSRAPSEAPALYQFGRVMRLVLGGNLESLGELFEIRASGNPKQWELELLPLGMVAGYLERIEVEGGEQIKTVRVVESAGNRMTLHLHAVRELSHPDPALAPLLASQRTTGVKLNPATIDSE